MATMNEFAKDVLTSEKSRSTNAKFPVDILYMLASTFVDNIDDYPTLIALSMTCRTFHSVIHNHKTLLPKAFLWLERPNLTALAAIESQEFAEVDSYKHMGAHRHCSDMAYLRKHVPTVDFEYHDRWIRAFDLFRHGTGQLTSMNWFPCYGCQRILPGATHFFGDHVRGCHELLGCRAHERRCVSCCMTSNKQWWRFVPLPSGRRYDDPNAYHPAVGRDSLKYLNRYLIGMPGGVQGYRMRCGACRVVSWVLKRPKQLQESKKLCDDCFEQWERGRELEESMETVWWVMRNMPFEPSRKR